MVLKGVYVMQCGEKRAPWARFVHMESESSGMVQKCLGEGLCDGMRPREKGGPRSDPTRPPHLAGVDSAHHVGTPPCGHMGHMSHLPPSHLAGVDSAHHVGAPPCGHMGQVGDVARQLLHDQLVNGAHNLHGGRTHN